MSIDNVFSATYKNYLIVSNLYTSAASQQLLYAKMRLSSTDASTNYDYLISYMTTGAGPTRDYGTGGTLGMFFGCRRLNRHVYPCQSGDSLGHKPYQYFKLIGNRYLPNPCGWINTHNGNRIRRNNV
jgi:hypothetical protein